MTTLRTEPNGLSGTLYLIRSYDHEKRNSPDTSRVGTGVSTMGTSRSNTSMINTELPSAHRSRHGDQNDGDRVNHGKAQSFEIWEVARAATAAKWVFKPLEIKLPGSRGHVVFRDGGLGPANNPSQEAFYELEDLYGANAIGIAVSVGTARKEQNLKPNFFNSVPGAAKEFATSVTDPENIHRSIHKKFESDGVPYFRINDPGMLGIEMDEWKPRRTFRRSISGSKTLTTIENAFNAWIAEPDNQKLLRRCATRLVRSRQARMHTAKWERFATGARFVCRARRCDSPDFLDRQSFANHLAEEHPKRLNTHGEEEEACKRRWRYRAAPNV